MFETAELGRHLDKKTFDDMAPALRVRLLEMQHRVQDTRLPVHILINGVDGAGKGETVNLLASWMDPRFLTTRAWGPRSDEEASRPFFWRFWRDLSPAGRIGLYFGSWYTEPITARVDGALSDHGFSHRLTQIEAFERLLVDDGAVLVKLWFHLSKKAQKKRIHALLDDERTAWRVSPHDLANLERYDHFARVSEEALRATSTGQAPWHIIEGEDDAYRSVTVAETLLASVERALAQQPPAVSAPPPAPQKKPAATSTKKHQKDEQPKTILDTLDLSRAVDKDAYDDELELLQGRLAVTWRAARAIGLSLTVVFEGWDAAGKGGAIRRVTPALDARDYRVIPIAAPSDEEKAHHWLWRFWRHVPHDGRVTLYDRSWYGRVLVERVEGFADEAAWMRAYDEINAFEEQLAEDRIVVVKLWLHIDRDEQLARFKAREKTPFKHFKISDEDYRNRDQWDAYARAVHDMVERTSTSYAPWHLVPANDKRFARLEVLRVLCDSLDAALAAAPSKKKKKKNEKKKTKTKTKKKKK